MANAPLVGAGHAEGTTTSDFRKEIFLAPRLNNPHQIDSAHEIGFKVQAIPRR
jgi:hypothetical protein